MTADAQSMLLSLVFNRGSSLSGSRRREMKAIQPLVIEKDLRGIAEQIKLVKRLWDRSILPGLHIRRDAEAEMIENAPLEHDSSEIIRV